MGIAYSLNAQYDGNVGINTTTPTATLNVKGKGTTTSTQALRIENAAGTDLLTINDNGTVSGSSLANFGSGAGTNGLNALVNTIPEASGSNCAAGGIRIVSGQDNNGNGLLDQSEITETRYVCNGTNGLGFANGTAGGQIYLTGASAPFSPQVPISMNGDVGINATGTTAIVSNAVTTAKINDLAVTTGKLANASVTTGKISATGTPSATTYLRGDGSWQAPASGGSGIFSAQSFLQNNSSVYITPVGYQSNQATSTFYFVAQTVPFACTLDQLTLVLTPTQASAGTVAPNVTVQLYINNVATPMQLSAPTSGVVNVSTSAASSSSVTIQKGDTFAFLVTQNFTGQVIRVATALRYQAL